MNKVLYILKFLRKSKKKSHAFLQRLKTYTRYPNQLLKLRLDIPGNVEVTVGLNLAGSLFCGLGSSQA